MLLLFTCRMETPENHSMVIMEKDKAKVITVGGTQLVPPNKEEKLSNGAVVTVDIPVLKQTDDKLISVCNVPFFLSMYIVYITSESTAGRVHHLQGWGHNF